MNLQDYFAITPGNGIISTADIGGIVNSAVFTIPHCMDNGLVAFPMRESQTYENISANPSACYLFIEEGAMTGKRLYLTKVRVEKNSQLAAELFQDWPEASSKDEFPHLVIFRVDKILPLIGYEEAS